MTPESYPASLPTRYNFHPQQSRRVGRRGLGDPANKGFTLIELLACQRKPWRRQARSAFTLIELLVVIAIIAVLAAMLLPVLSMAKNRAQMAVDLNNVHQILLAAHLYANDNHDYLPRAGYNDGGQTAVPNWCFSNPWNLAPTPGSPTTYNTYYPQQVRSFKSLNSDGTPTLRANACQLTPYLKNEKVLRCPADVPNTLMYQRQVYITSYAWSGVIYAFNGTAGDAGYPSTYYSLKLSQFSPSGIMLWENNELNVPGGWCDLCNWPSTLEGISKRHGKGATIGRFSGAAERIPMSAWVSMANAPAASGPNDCWCNPLSATGH